MGAREHEPERWRRRRRVLHDPNGGLDQGQRHRPGDLLELRLEFRKITGPVALALIQSAIWVMKYASSPPPAFWLVLSSPHSGRLISLLCALPNAASHFNP